MALLPNNEAKLFIGNLPPDITTEELQYVFNNYGTVSKCHVMDSSRSKSGQACAFVSYTTPEAAAVAIQTLNNVYKIRTDAKEPISVSVAKGSGQTEGSAIAAALVAAATGGVSMQPTLGAIPGLAQTALAQPTLAQPSLAQPGLDEAALAQPAFAQPTLAQPTLSHPGLAQPGLAQPGLAQPGLAQPGLAQPGLAQPGLAPGLAQPGLAQPGLTQPGLAPWDPNQPGLAQPGLAPFDPHLPGLAQPGLAQPGLAQPWLAQPGLAQPGLTQPGLAQTQASLESAVAAATQAQAAAAQLQLAAAAQAAVALPTAGILGQPAFGTPCKLFIGDLPGDIAREALVAVFSTYGTVTDVHLMTGKSRSGAACALVEYSNQTEAQTAIATLHQKYEIKPGSGMITVRHFEGSKGKGKGGAAPAAGVDTSALLGLAPAQPDAAGLRYTPY